MFSLYYYYMILPFKINGNGEHAAQAVHQSYMHSLASLARKYLLTFDMSIGFM